MPKLEKYENMSIQVIQKPMCPHYVLSYALGITMKQNLTDIKVITESQIQYLLEAEHTSLFEHIAYTFLIEGISRSFLAQITRHRMSSFTTGSQHYQTYSDYPCVVINNSSPLFQSACNQSFEAYNELIILGYKKEEARQVLPNAASVNILWTINARSLINFLKLRLCKRNVIEMQVFANRILSLVRVNFPELFDHIGPQCFMGKCKQGHLKCKDGPWTRTNNGN